MSVIIDGTNGITTPDIDSTTYGGVFSEDGTYLRLASGTGGIQFNGDTSSDNALDDYETGLFNPNLFDITTGTDFSTQSSQGRYIKIGNFVFVTVRLFNASTSASTNDVGMRLPFSVGDIRNQPANILLYSISFGSAVSAFILDGGDFVRFSQVIGSISDKVTCNQVGSGLRGYFSIAYSTV